MCKLYKYNEDNLEWRHKMKAQFYINTFLAKKEPCTPRVHAVDLFSNIKENMKRKLGTYKINDCTILEAKIPFKFFNYLFLFRTSANTIACSTIVHVQDAINWKEVDWPTLFNEHMKMELITLKEKLYKVKTTSLRTLIGPPFTMFLISGGFLTIQQKKGRDIDVFHFRRETIQQKKNEHALEQGNSSKEGESPHILVARMEEQ